MVAQVEPAENQWVVLSKQHYYTRELQRTAQLKNPLGEVVGHGSFDSSGVFAATIVIAVVALIAERLLTDRGPVADLASGDYRQRMSADSVLVCRRRS